MKKLTAPALLIAIALAGCAAPAAAPEMEPAAVQIQTVKQSEMIAEIRPMLTSKPSDAQILADAYRACLALTFQSVDDYREKVMSGSDLDANLDKLVIAAAAKGYICP